MKSKILVVTALILCLVISASKAANIYVDVASPNDPGSGTINDPFRRIQPAINAAVTGDTIIINQGLYTGPGNFNLDPNGKLITIRSTDPNDITVVANTIIDPQGAGRGFYIHKNENEQCIISGLTIRNGYIDSEIEYNGAGIYCYGSSPLISNCIITNGYAAGYGGGIGCYGADATIVNCILQNNTAGYYGGGVSCESSNVNITSCMITGNNAIEAGGGIDCGDSNSTILNCLIINNNALNGGGMNFFGSTTTDLINCTIAKNSATKQGGAFYSLSYRSHCNIFLKNSIVWSNSAAIGKQIYLDANGNTAIEYSDIEGGIEDVCDPFELLTWGIGNITSDPCFASFNTGGDPNLWDFHLKSRDGRWNTAFYKTDFNSDGKIDFADFAELARVWNQSGNRPEDLDYSGFIDWQDLLLFAQYFTADNDTRGWIIDSLSSPCINAGDPNSSWTAEPWPNGKRINMGAFGGTNQASKSGNPADFNVDNIVNFVDFADLGQLWGQFTNAIEDLNKDGTLNINDLEILATNWLQ